MLIQELPSDERPREKITEMGAAALSDAEILALFLRTGRPGVSAVGLAREIMDRFGSLRNLSRAPVADFLQVNGIGPAKAAELAAVIEFGKRLAREPFGDRPVSSPEEAFQLVGPEMQTLSQESVRAILLNHRKKLIHVVEVFVGTGNESFANPAQVLRTAIAHAAHGFILVHNHPSGDPSPSRADHDATRRMKTAAEAVGIEFTDHIIVGCRPADSGEPYFSFREAGLI